MDEIGFYGIIGAGLIITGSLLTGLFAKYYFKK